MLALTTTIQNGYLPFNQQPYPGLNDENVMQYVLSKKDLFIKIVHEFRRMHLTTQPQQAPPPMPPATSFAMPNPSTTENSYAYDPISTNGSHADRVDPIEENHQCADDCWPFGDNY